MDGMSVYLHDLGTGSARQGETASYSHTVRLAKPASVIAEISLASLAHLYVQPKIDAFCVFTACTTDGSNPGLPASETFAQGSISGNFRNVVIRRGLTSITYEMDVQDCIATFVVNLFFWPDVNHGSL
jgi:hypothetical protein